MARAILKGIPISPGIAIGPLIALNDAHNFEKRRIGQEEVEGEIEALNCASRQVCQGLEETMRNIPDNLSEYREIIASQMELANDPKLMEGAKARIRHRKICASWAVAETIAELCSLFQDMADADLGKHADDIRLIGHCLCNSLGGARRSLRNGKSGILAAHDLSPADVMDLKLAGVEGILTVEGGIASHVAIFARGLHVPAIAGINGLFREARPDETTIVDGLSGLAILGPDETDLAHYRYRQSGYTAFEEEALASASLPARTRDGVVIHVAANLVNTSELAGLPQTGAEGIGLYRTEFSYLADALPGEESLVEEYRAVLASAGGAKVVFRTLDVGADKLIYRQDFAREPNPALGLRGIRFCLRHTDIFRSQLRAILRASHDQNAAIMLPMVSSLVEVEETRELIGRIKRELEAEHLDFAANIPLGVMVETPAAVMISDALAANCDFLSIGTNDLLHYLMAIDRNNRHVSYLHEPLHAGFIRSLKRVIDAGHERGIEVSVCGELASDPAGVAILLGLGVDTLSVAPRFVPGIKYLLRKLDAGACAQMANMAMNEHDVAKSRDCLHNLLRDHPESRLSFQQTLLPDEAGQ